MLNQVNGCLLDTEASRVPCSSRGRGGGQATSANFVNAKFAEIAKSEVQLPRISIPRTTLHTL